MTNNITRRDYLNGMAFVAAGVAMSGCSPATSTDPTATGVKPLPGNYYPPILNGMRGSQDGSYEVAHELAWSGVKPTDYLDVDDAYDLIVVGAGISGLAAACLYQQKAGVEKRILILDNHDDFGGHARRNEFQSGEKMILAAGGSGNFQDSYAYSPEVKALISDIGFDLESVRASMEPTYFSPDHGLYMNSEFFNADGIVHGPWPYAWFGEGDVEGLVATLGLPDSEEEKLVGFIRGTRPLEKELPAEEIGTALGSIDYKQFLTDYVGLDEKTTALWRSFMDVTYLVSIDCLSIREGIEAGLPGLNVLSPEAIATIDLSKLAQEYDIVWMPDGNGSLVRQMVRKLIPNVASGETIDDLVTARFDYSQLDQTDNAVRLRLNSTVVNAVNNSDDTVSVSYVQDGNAYRVKAANCIMACNHNMIPHICPELPTEQKESLLYGVRGPMMIANVLVKDGQAFYATGSEIFQCPNSPFCLVTKAPPTSLGDYNYSSAPEDPMVIYMLGAPAAVARTDEETARDLFRAGRQELYVKTFEEFEQEIRDQLNGMLGPFGFDSDRDIEAITLNRWSHGYAYPGFELFDPAWAEGEAPNVIGSKPFGRIAIANSDATYVPYLGGAIDAASRAVSELPA